MKRIRFDDFVYEFDGTYTYDGLPLTGIACDYFPDGSIWSEMQFIDGHQEGPAREWYENGQLKSEQMFLGERLHGPSKEWYPNGQLKEASVCEFGVCLESTEWDESGLLVKHFSLQPTDVNYQYLAEFRALWTKK